MNCVVFSSDPRITGEMLTSARRAVRLAKGVASSNESNSLRVIHAHAAEGLANVEGRHAGVTIAVGALGVDIDQTHVSGGKGFLQAGGTANEVGATVITDIVPLGHKGGFGTPENAFIRLPRIGTTAGKAQDWEAHLLEGRVTGQENQVGPRNGFAVLHLDRPQQAPCLIEIRVVRPAIKGREALLAL